MTFDAVTQNVEVEFVRGKGRSHRSRSCTFSQALAPAELSSLLPPKITPLPQVSSRYQLLSVAARHLTSHPHTPSGGIATKMLPLAR